MPFPADDPPHDLLCPITHALFRDPVFNSHGNTYDRVAICAAFAAQAEHGPRDPLTNVALPDARLVPDQRARRAVTAWLETHRGGEGLPLPPLDLPMASTELDESEEDEDEQEDTVPWSQTEDGMLTLQRMADNDPDLTELVLYADNCVCDTCAFALARALATNTHLVRLHIGDEFVEDFGVAAIAEALKTNTTLVYLELCVGAYTMRATGVLALADMLTHNRTLRRLDVRGTGRRGLAYALAVLVATANSSQRDAPLVLLADGVDLCVGGRAPP